ncbi:DUF885 domain-containing protein [Sphingosinicella sp. LHD-64]|uniref:DUF885 domain-containing protein n=1 Tax=Sphingosinicella sp. LHD-64 TaxID=3072139 RepID=UPI00280E04BD|nr:DUF885 domain-containing protein [Sphingosinicella sp. LHD-64]MDQ8757266.1 DUF885 domain-containing protein [Sphingosinicella sp. LHD-64]
MTGWTRRDLLRSAGAAGIAAALPGPAWAGQVADPSARLRAAIAASDRARRALDPLGTLRQGLPLAGPAFVDPLGDDYADAVARSAASDQEALDDIDRAALSNVDAIAYDVLRYRAVQTLDAARSGLADVQRRAPLNASFGLHLDFPDYVVTRAPQLATPADHALMLAQMAGFAGHLRSITMRLREGVADGYVESQVVAANVLRQLDAMLETPLEQSPFMAPVRQLPEGLAEERPQLDARYRATIEREIRPGLAAWRAYLAEDYLPRTTRAPGRWAMKDGRALYASELVRHTTTSDSADEIHRLGRAEVERIRGEMERTRTEIGFSGDLPAFFAHIRTDPRFYHRRQEDLIAHFERIEERIWDGMPRLFGRRPRAPFEVRPLPALGGQRGTGYYRAGPADGSGPGILYFNMAMLDTRPIPTMETLTLHEGIPGHHYQISLVQEDTALPDLLRFGSVTAFSEGWGLYAESLGRELGLFEDPYQWFGHLDMEMLRAVRLVVDTGLHDKEWSRQQAIDYMLANTSMAPRDVEVEIDRYISIPGQACAYKMGELKILDLRRRANARLGGRFDIRAFHDQVIGTGALPLAILDDKIMRWAGAAA